MAADMPLPWFDHRFPLYLAPMAGVTDPIFRTLCKEEGADVMVTEFVSSEGVLQAWNRNRRYVSFLQSHRPLGVQLFGSNPSHMAQAARLIVDEMRPDFIDLNAGCPVPKVVGKNGGSSLLKNLPLLQDIAGAVVDILGNDCPVTAKIRIGWDTEHICALEAGQRLQDAGVQALAIHGRTRSQQYGGKADWNIIDACAKTLNIPVIGNGDISSPEDVKTRREHTAVSGLMIGRAAMSSPWIFRQAKEYLRTGKIAEEPTIRQRLQFILRHAHMAVSSGHYGNEASAMRAMRTKLLAYVKNISGSKSIRPQLARVENLEELESLLNALG